MHHPFKTPVYSERSIKISIIWHVLNTFIQFAHAPSLSLSLYVDDKQWCASNPMMIYVLESVCVCVSVSPILSNILVCASQMHICETTHDRIGVYGGMEVSHSRVKTPHKINNAWTKRERMRAHTFRQLPELMWISMLVIFIKYSRLCAKWLQIWSNNIIFLVLIHISGKIWVAFKL